MRFLTWIVSIVVSLFILWFIFRAVGLLFTVAIAVIALALLAGIGHKRRHDRHNHDFSRRNSQLRTEFAEDKFNHNELRNHQNRQDHFKDHNDLF